MNPKPSLPDRPQGDRSSDERDLRRSAASALLVQASRSPALRRLCLEAALRLEGGEFYSATAREILRTHHGVDVGAYSYGECLIPGGFPRGVAVGRYVSVASGVRVFLRNHPLERLSLHPFFYNRTLGWLDEDSVQTGTLVIGHDAWIGERAIVTPGCSRIGIGAVVGAGAVVTRDVADFGIVAGNPARLIRHRFPPETCARILESRWWDRSIEECARHMADMIRPLPEEPSRHPLLAGAPLSGPRATRVGGAAESRG
jgi:virginiamycin A acetyltransferase